MADALSPEELNEMRDVVRNLAGPVLDEAEHPEGADELELMALNAMGPFADPEAPAELVSLLPAALEERGDEVAAGLLAVYAVLGPLPLAEPSAEARDRLAAAGVVSPLAETIGTLRPQECYRLELSAGPAEALGAHLRRRGDTRVQSAVVIIEQGPSGEVIVDGFIDPAEDPDVVSRELEGPAAEDARIETPSPAATERRLVGALRYMVECELALESEAVPALAVLERALTGRNGRWPRPVLAVPDHVGADADEEEEERLRGEADALVEEFAAVLEEQAPSEGALREHGPEVAFLMLDWKIGYADRELTRWTHDDLREFLLEWYPRKGDSDEDSLAAVPAAVVAFVHFLATHGRLSGADAEALAATVERLRARFLEAARDRILGPPSEAHAPVEPSPARNPISRARGDRRGKRKATRAARKRNRR